MRLREQELEDIRRRNMALAQQEEEREREREQERQRRGNLETSLQRTVTFSVRFYVIAYQVAPLLFPNLILSIAQLSTKYYFQVVPLLFPVVTACKELLYGQHGQLEHLRAVSTRGGGVGDAERWGDIEGTGGTKGGGGSESSSSRHSRDGRLGVNLHPGRKKEGGGGGEGGVLGVSRGVLRKIWIRRSVGWGVVCGLG
jgi:hypothetical protein